MCDKMKECYHDEYCSLNEFVCETSDFSEFCLMRETPLEELELLQAVKERGERDKARGFKFLNKNATQ